MASGGGGNAFTLDEPPPKQGNLKDDLSAYCLFVCYRKLEEKGVRKKKETAPKNALETSSSEGRGNWGTLHYLSSVFESW